VCLVSTKKKRRRKKIVTETLPLGPPLPVMHLQPLGSPLGPPLSPHGPPLLLPLMPETLVLPHMHLPVLGPQLAEWTSTGSYLTQNGIGYRLYDTALHADSVLGDHLWADHVGSLPNVTKSWHTLTNDVHSAIAHQNVGVAKASVKRIKIRKGTVRVGDDKFGDAESPYLTVIHTETDGYYAVLERLPILSQSGCKVIAAIGKSLGGKVVTSAAGRYCCFQSREVAIHHILLSAICVVGSAVFYGDLVSRARRDAGFRNSGTHIAGYFAGESAVLDIGYYLVVREDRNQHQGQQAFPTLIIVFPCRTRRAGGIGPQSHCAVRLM
jgi:hypothetical protein